MAHLVSGVELGRCNIHADYHFARVAGLGNGLHNQVQALGVALRIRITRDGMKHTRASTRARPRTQCATREGRTALRTKSPSSGSRKSGKITEHKVDNNWTLRAKRQGALSKRGAKEAACAHLNAGSEAALITDCMANAQHQNERRKDGTADMHHMHAISSVSLTVKAHQYE